MHNHSLHPMFPVLAIIISKEKWMQGYMHQILSIRCRQILCKYWMHHHCLHTKNSSGCNNYITSLIDAGLYASKLNSSIGCRQLVAGIGCSIMPCIESISSSCNYYCMSAQDMGIQASQLNASMMSPNCLQVIYAAKLFASNICSIMASN